MEDLEDFETMTQALDAATGDQTHLYWTNYNDTLRDAANAAASEVLGSKVRPASSMDQILSATYAKGRDMGVGIVAELLGIRPSVMIEALSMFDEEGAVPPLTPALIAHLRSFNDRGLQWNSDLAPFLADAGAAATSDVPVGAAND